MNKNMNELYHKPNIFNQFPNIIAAQSTRNGGVSEAPFGSLNLSFRVGDSEENVIENRKRFFNGQGIDLQQLATSHQVHGDKILYAIEPGDYDGFDALITNRHHVFVTVSVADCTPILLYDAENEVVAAIHAGWRGTVDGIVYKTLETMQDHFGTNAQNCYAYIGTCIDECSYEVDADVADHFPNEFKRFDAKLNKFFVDLKAGNKDQLLEFGIPESQIEVSPFSTVLHNEQFFSHRAERGKTGRMMAVIGMHSM
ncbi:MAG: peptidoglycan editing factor PgeF [Saprospiraceae bacterium]|nr:peptidoglycan editing factor PgeF [Saprospiraceae bacterium]